jgi:hypothetical protein
MRWSYFNGWYECSCGFARVLPQYLDWVDDRITDNAMKPYSKRKARGETR